MSKSSTGYYKKKKTSAVRSRNIVCLWCPHRISGGVYIASDRLKKLQIVHCPSVAVAMLLSKYNGTPQGGRSSSSKWGPPGALRIFSFPYSRRPQSTSVRSSYSPGKSVAFPVKSCRHISSTRRYTWRVAGLLARNDSRPRCNTEQSIT